MQRGKGVLVVSREQGLDRHYGLGRSVGRICEELNQLGVNTVPLSLEETTPYHRRWSSRLSFLSRWFGAAAQLVVQSFIQGAAAADQQLQHQYSAVWLQDPLMVAGYRLGLLRRGRRLLPGKLVVSQHGLGSFTWAVLQDGITLEQKHYVRLLRWERYQLSLVDSVVYPSQAALNLALRDFNLATRPSNWHSILHGMDSHAAPNRASARAHLGLDPNTLYVVALGRLASVKRYPLLVEAVRTLQSEGMQVQLRIAGAGDIERFAEENAIDAMEYPVQLGHTEDSALLLSACDIYVSCCDKESFGLANQEAIAAGAACILPAAGAAPEVAASGAWLINMDQASLTAALRELCQHPELRASWRQRAQAIATTKQGWRAVANDYADLLEHKRT